MRYRRVSYRYAEVVRSVGLRPLGDLWQVLALRALADTVWRPPADIYETPDALYVRAELAGVSDDDVEVALYADTLVIEGVRQNEPLPKGSRYHCAEIRYGPFRIEVPLPYPVDADRATAHYERGFLTVQLPLQQAGAR
jgi:HSP20 family protein